jgi:hypothetical protein
MYHPQTCCRSSHNAITHKKGRAYAPGLFYLHRIEYSERVFNESAKPIPKWVDIPFPKGVLSSLLQVPDPYRDFLNSGFTTKPDATGQHSVFDWK